MSETISKSKEFSEILERLGKHYEEILNIVESIQSTSVSAVSEPARKRLKILLAVDHSEISKRAIGYAVAAAISSSGEIVMLHVTKSGSWDSILNEEANKIRSYGINVKTRVEFGDPAETILKVAEEEKADMIVLGVRGVSAWKRLILGSVSERVLEEAKVPVLVVR